MQFLCVLCIIDPLDQVSKRISKQNSWQKLLKTSSEEKNLKQNSKKKSKQNIWKMLTQISEKKSEKNPTTDSDFVVFLDNLFRISRWKFLDFSVICFYICGCLFNFSLSKAALRGSHGLSAQRAANYKSGPNRPLDFTNISTNTLISLQWEGRLWDKKFLGRSVFSSKRGFVTNKLVLLS